MGTEGLSVFPDHILEAISDLVDDTKLGDGSGKYPFNDIGKAFLVIGAGDKDIFYPAGFEIRQVIVSMYLENCCLIDF